MLSHDQASAPDSPRGRWETGLLIVILLVAAFMRLWRLDLMEFKDDEAQACVLAARVLGDAPPGSPKNFPLAGLQASVGLPNSPLFVYLLALPLSWSRDPVAAAAFIAMCNIAAVGLCYYIGRRYFSPNAGLMAAALFALAPWAVIYSRKIWAQELLPLPVGVFLLAAHAFLVDRRPGAAGLMLLAVGIALQLHFSAIILVGVTAYAFVAGREALRWPWVAAGVAISLFLAAPFLWHLATAYRVDWSALQARHADWAQGVPSDERLILALRYALAVAAGDVTQVLTGIHWPGTLPLGLAASLGGVGGLIWLCVRDRATRFFHARVMLLVWMALPSLGLMASGIVAYPHYFIILYPIPFLGLAALLDAFRGRARCFGMTLLGGLLAYNFTLLAASGRLIATQGGAPEEYGVAYKCKLEAVRSMLAESGPQPSLVVATDFALTHPVPPEYAFLFWREIHSQSAPGQKSPAIHPFVLLNTFTTELSPEGAVALKNVPRRQFGPLIVFSLPPRT